MSLADTVTHNMRMAMKAKDSATLSTLRLLLAGMKNKKIEVQHELSDAEIQDVVKMQVKQLKDSIDSFTQAGREDLVASARLEIVVLGQYLPAQMSDDELARVVKEVVEKSGATNKADIGKVMGAAMAAVAGRADGSRVKEIVASLLPVFVLAVTGVAVSQDALAAFPLIETFSSGSLYTTIMLRVTRVLILWLGIIAITLILSGGFQYMVASNNDDNHTKALTKITHGIFGTLIVAGIFAFCTVALQKIG